MTGLLLDPLTGTNPLGFLAALGALDVATRAAADGARPSLHWTEELVPRAVLTGSADIDELVSLVDDDRSRWQESALLMLPGEDVKPGGSELHKWADDIRKAARKDRPSADLFCALLAEGAVAGNGLAKPTHLHFTAGQQRFLSMVRQLAAEVDRAAVTEALTGPWRYASPLPVLGWDSRGERIYALRGFDPAGEKRTGVPGADWLAFLGLTFFPVTAHDEALQTACCDGSWKRGTFTWPLWKVPLPASVIRSLLTDAKLAELTERERRARGVFRLLKAPIRRSEQGGYGSIGAAEPAPPARNARRRSAGG
jgi:hypothetical protein